MTCATHIIECLANKGIKAHASASSEFDVRYASNALIYDRSNFYQSAPQSKPQWWSINFKQPISINGYEIMDEMVNSGSSCIYNWTLSVSLNNKTWTVIHGPVQNAEAVKSYNFAKSYNAIYVRIDGNSKLANDPTRFSFYYIKFFASFIHLKNRFSCKVQRRIDMNLIRIILLIYS